MTSSISNQKSSNPIEIAPLLPNPALLEANWADAFEVTIQRHFADMRALAQASVGSMPEWSRKLLALRNGIVRPLGLKPDGLTDAGCSDDLIDIFPIHSETENRIVLGLNDRHLDFRIVIERDSKEAGEKIRLTTLVRHHNLLGHLYITVITPFHKAIVRSVLKQIA